MKCDRCGTTEVKHYKQRRRDGVWVVTARCENGHIPETGRPFYPISQFDISALPVLGSQKDEQPELFTTREIDRTPMSLIDYVEQKRNWRFTK